MQFINYFLISVVSFLGLVIGIILVQIAPEEQKPLNKYLIILRQILLLMIFAFIAFYYSGSAFYLPILAAYFILAALVEYRLKGLIKKSMITSSALGVLFFLSMQNSNLFAIESSLILLYGIPTASLIYKKKEKNQYKLLFYNAGFIVVANLLYFT
jgi:hypothetical protein